MKIKRRQYFATVLNNKNKNFHVNTNTKIPRIVACRFQFADFAEGQIPVSYITKCFQTTLRFYRAQCRHPVCF